MVDVEETGQVFYDKIFYHRDVIKALIEHFETEDLYEIFYECYRAYYQNMNEEFVAKHLSVYEGTCELPDFVLSIHASILEKCSSQQTN